MHACIPGFSNSFHSLREAGAGYRKTKLTDSVSKKQYYSKRKSRVYISLMFAVSEELRVSCRHQRDTFILVVKPEK